MVKSANYKLTVEITADKLLDLEQLLCVIAEQILNGEVSGSGGDGRVMSYVFNVKQSNEAQDI